MKTQILKPSQIEDAANLLKKGELVAIPTETVYGLAADASNEEAIRKIFVAKRRPTDHPLIVHIASFEAAREWAKEIPESAIKIAEHFWPGPLTLILKKRKNVSPLITGGQQTIALRMPINPIALQIIERLGKPIAAPSANAHKRTSPTKPEHVLKTLSGKIAAVVDGGQSSVGLESTIIDMTAVLPTVVRPGAITSVMIQKVLRKEVREKYDDRGKVPGSMPAHYQPEKPLFLFSGEEIKEYSLQENNIAILHYTNLAKNKNALYYKMPENSREYAKILYDVLYTIDSTSVNKIWVEKPPQHVAWAHVIDRLNRASS